MPLAQAAWKLPMRPLRVAGLRVRRKVLDRSGIELLERRAQQGEHGLKGKKNVGGDRVSGRRLASRTLLLPAMHVG